MSLTDNQLMLFLKDTLQIDHVDIESELFSSGMLDSVSMVNLIAFIEEKAGVQVRAEDVTLENFDTPARILRYAEVNA